MLVTNKLDLKGASAPFSVVGRDRIVEVVLYEKEKIYICYEVAMYKSLGSVSLFGAHYVNEYKPDSIAASEIIIFSLSSVEIISLFSDPMSISLQEADAFAMLYPGVKLFNIKTGEIYD